MTNLFAEEGSYTITTWECVVPVLCNDPIDHSRETNKLDKSKNIDEVD